MEIRKMTKEDLSEVVRIEESIFGLPWSYDSFLSAIEREDNVYLVATEGQKIMGYVGMYVLFGEGEIVNVAVAEEYRRRGVARALMEELFAYKEERSLERLILEVRLSNLPAKHLYDSLGFSEIGIRKDFYEAPREDAYIMEINLC